MITLTINRVKYEISDYVKRNDGNYMCQCPLHKSGGRALGIDPEEGLYKCFSCLVGGKSVIEVTEA